MSGEWKGWQDWNKFKKAGIVENSVDFSEEAIIVDHAVGRTKNAIGKCWPMDAAVAYTLMKGGPDKPLKWADMVNYHTRAAAVMMTGTVGYGNVPIPETKTCGVDEVSGYTHIIGTPYVNDGELIFKTGYGSGNLDTWLTDQGEGDNDATIATLKELYVPLRVKDNLQGLDATVLLTDAYFAPLLAFLKERFPDATTLMSASIIKTVNSTKGKCGWAGVDQPTCRHHDSPTEQMWSMRRNGDNGGFRQAWVKGPCGQGDNHHQWSQDSSQMIASEIVRWTEMSRSMAEKVPELTVIGHIRDSLARMLKRNDNIVSKIGRGKNSLHSWSDWGWLAEMAAHIKNTSSKNRKEGDTENGWAYSKVRSRHSFGHEIADFVWKPVAEVKDYVVGREEPSDWQGSSIMSTLRFSSKQAVIDFMALISQAHLDAAGHYSNRTHDGLEKEENGKWSVRSIPIPLVMLGSVDPEDYLSPDQVVAMWRQAAPAVLAEHKANFERAPNFTVKQAPPQEVVNSDGE